MAVKTGDNVVFTTPTGKTYYGQVVNARHYPGGARSGKHYRIRVLGGGGMVATIFANGPTGKTVKVVK